MGDRASGPGSTARSAGFPLGEDETVRLQNGRIVPADHDGQPVVSSDGPQVRGGGGYRKGADLLPPAGIGVAEDDYRQVAMVPIRTMFDVDDLCVGSDPVGRLRIRTGGQRKKELPVENHIFQEPHGVQHCASKCDARRQGQAAAN